MTRPTLEVADILRVQGDHFLARYRSSFDFSSSKPFVPFNAAAPRPWAGIAMLARVVVIRPSPTTRVAIGTATSARHRRVSVCWQHGNANFSTPAISTWSSPYLTS